MVQAVYQQRWYHDGAKVCMDFCGRSGQGARNQGTAANLKTSFNSDILAKIVSCDTAKAYNL